MEVAWFELALRLIVVRGIGTGGDVCFQCHSATTLTTAIVILHRYTASNEIQSKESPMADIGSPNS